MTLGSNQKANWAVEVKWSDRDCDNLSELKSVLSFCRSNQLRHILVISRTKTLTCEEQGITIQFLPASLYCFTAGYNLIRGRTSHFSPEQLEVQVPTGKTVG